MFFELLSNSTAEDNAMDVATTSVSSSILGILFLQTIIVDIVGIVLLIWCRSETEPPRSPTAAPASATPEQKRAARDAGMAHVLPYVEYTFDLLLGVPQILFSFGVSIAYLSEFGLQTDVPAGDTQVYVFLLGISEVILGLLSLSLYFFVHGFAGRVAKQCSTFCGGRAYEDEDDDGDVWDPPESLFSFSSLLEDGAVLLMLTFMNINLGVSMVFGMVIALLRVDNLFFTFGKCCFPKKCWREKDCFECWKAAGLPIRVILLVLFALSFFASVGVAIAMVAVSGEALSVIPDDNDIFFRSSWLPLAETLKLLELVLVLVIEISLLFDALLQSLPAPTEHILVFFIHFVMHCLAEAMKVACALMLMLIAVEEEEEIVLSEANSSEADYWTSKYLYSGIVVIVAPIVGVGYWLGLMGVVMFCQGRKKLDRPVI